MKTRTQRLLDTVDEVMGPNFRAAATRQAASHRDDDPPDPYARIQDNRKPMQADITPDADPRY